MKQLSLSLLFVALCCAQVAFAATPIKGRVINSKQEPVGYATVVALADSTQVAGATTDEKGRFSLTLADGNYTLLVDFVGYNTHEQKISIPRDSALGDITLTESTTDIDEVVVKAQLIRREADRFVVDVANSDMALGKDGEELLRQSPGVWIDDEKISINGASGTKVYINEREVKLSGMQLVNYIKNLRAENIAKIEIIPQTGADYDANSSGGIIKITLKRRLDNGVIGSVSMYSNQSDKGYDYNPYANINAVVGKFDLSAYGGYYTDKTTYTAEEITNYTKLGAVMNSNSAETGKFNSHNINLSAIYQINPKHSVGVSGGYYNYDRNNELNANTSFKMAASDRLSKSRYITTGDNPTFWGTFNYIFKSDSLGSTLKFIADYTSDDSYTLNNNSSNINEGAYRTDSLYYDKNNALFRVATASLARERVFSPKLRLKYGAKYTYNEINADAEYRYLQQGAWTPSKVDDYDISYRENIGAMYMTASSRIGRFSAVVGLRGEFTNVQGKGDGFEQNYFSLFPNANFSFSLDKEGKHSIVAQYSRGISRPSFWNLTPTRRQLSDYTYQTGNPMLDPAYVNTFSLVGVVAHKYTITLSTSLIENSIQQMIVTDENDSKMMNITHTNLPTLNQYALSANIPLTVTKWWDWNINMVGIIMEQQMTPTSERTTHPMWQYSTQATFKLPKKFYIDLSAYGMSKATVSNATVFERHSMSATLKKRFKDSWVVSCSFNDIIPANQEFRFVQDDVQRYMSTKHFANSFRVRIGATWNFKAGKQFNAKSIDRGNDGESRL